MPRAPGGAGPARRLLGALLLLVLGAFAAPTPAASIVVVRVESEGLNVRAHPSAASEVVGYLKRGEETIGTLGSADGWLLVRTRDGRTGYIAARFVKLVRVLAVDGQPVPSRAPGEADAGPCGPGAGPIEVAIRDVRMECRDRVLGQGVEGCDVLFQVESSAACTARIYRALECEVELAYLREGDAGEQSASARASTVMMLDGGVGANEVAVSWRAPATGAVVSAVRVETGSCVLR